MKSKSTILKDTFALFLITLLSGLALSLVFEVTKGPIEVQAEAKKIRAYQEVYEEAEEFIEDEELFLSASKTELVDLSSDYEGIKIDETNRALDSNGNMIGYVIKISTNKGYGGNISIVMGYSPEGLVKGVEIIEISETAGLGAKASEPNFKDQFSNKNVEQFVATKKEALADNEIDGISGATVTTEAVTNAVNAGIDFLKVYSSAMEVE